MTQKTAPEKETQKAAQDKDKETAKCLGPVPNLEAYVKPNWWNKIFNALYLKTDGDVVDDIAITKKEVDTFASILNLKRDAEILDVCCGQGRHVLEFARRGYLNVHGIDRSRFLMQKAKQLAKKECLNIDYREGDARRLPYPPDSFDVVTLLGNSFGYFQSASDDLRVLKGIFKVMKPWGKILIDITDGDFVKKNYKPRSWEWIDRQYFVCRERSVSVDEDRLISREVIVNADKGVIADQFYAERLYNKDTLESLLKNAGFSDVTFHGEMVPDSQRNQDLGMMEKRLIVTATCKKEWSQLKKKVKPGLKNVVVLFGDPHKRDPIKPQAIFDEDDFYTIDQMKAALKKLDGYNITYLTNHDTMITDLAKMKGKVDYFFNLCDEGYNNDPRKELHVPALLEMLGFNYTGGTPQCLAYCYDKALVRAVGQDLQVPCPKYVLITGEHTSFELPFEFPVLVKPNFGDSSFGITKNSVCYNGEQFVSSISEIRYKFGYDKPILVDEYLTGADISVGIIGNPPNGEYTILPIIEESYAKVPDDLPKICGYEAKWQPDSPYYQIESVPINLPPETKHLIEDCCVKLFDRLECRDYARFDWRLDKNGNPKLLEVNPNPGWCWDGHLCKMCNAGGISYPKMVEMILTSAESRWAGTESKTVQTSLPVQDQNKSEEKGSSNPDSEQK